MNGSSVGAQHREKIELSQEQMIEVLGPPFNSPPRRSGLMDPSRSKCVWPEVAVVLFVYKRGQRLVSWLLHVCQARRLINALSRWTNYPSPVGRHGGILYRCGCKRPKALPQEHLQKDKIYIRRHIVTPGSQLCLLHTHPSVHIKITNRLELLPPSFFLWGRFPAKKHSCLDHLTAYSLGKTGSKLAGPPEQPG